MKHHSSGMSARIMKLIDYDPMAGVRPIHSTKKVKRRDGGRVNLANEITEQAKVVNTDPSDGQKEAGNYRKGHIRVHGLDISIENPRGSFRSGVANGKPWKSRLPAHYGYIRKTEGGDGQHLDVYLGPHLKSSHVFVVDQHELGSNLWDEHKAFIGFGSKTQAREAYHRAFSDGKGKERIGHIEAMTVDEFKDWLRDGETTQPIKLRRRNFADGGAAFGTMSPAEDAERPRTFLDKATSGLINSIGSLPQRAIENSQYSLDTGNYDPSVPMETAVTLAGVGSPMAEKGAAGIFGGRLAKTADQAALSRAEEMAVAGADRGSIWNETGWFQGPDKKWRFEIPDDNLMVRKGYGAGLEFGAGESWGRFAPKIEHKDLTAAYPRKFDYLAHDVNVGRGAEPQGRFMPNGAGRDEEFFYADKPVLPTLFVESPTTKQARSIAAHELQHAVQGEEGFAAGANPEMMRSHVANTSAPPTYDELYSLYQRAAGEVEARNVQARLNMTREERHARPPWETEDVPAHEQIVRERGGRVHMADGGVPAFDATQPVAEGGPPPFEKTQPPSADPGKLRSAWQGLKSGATFNFSDELAGVRGAGPKEVPEFLGPLPARTMVGAGRLAANYFTGNDPEAVTSYEKARDEERAANAAAKEHHPYIHAAGEIAGSLPAMAVLPEAGIARGAGLGARMVQGATVGAEYGGLSGLGEGKDAGERALGAAQGIVSGIVGGGAAPVVGATAGLAYDKFGKPIVNAVRGAMDPAAEASRRLATALKADQELIAAGKAEGMTPQQWTAARQAGEPVTLADLGSSNTQALLRSAANTSPEGRALLEKTINERFAGQSERVADEVRGLVAGGANAHKTGDQLVAEYDRARVPGYRAAFQQGDKEIVSPVIERLMGSPTFEQAMKNAVTSGKDRAITEGYGAFNPSVTVENGMIKFTKTKPNGVPQYPNLQYWDSVKKELDAVANVARRSGDKERGDVAGNLAKTLRGELDTAVPSYGQVRGVAAQYFGESNALEAGQKLAGKKVDPKVIADVMKKMKPDERELFREGYASDWAGRVIGNISDSRDITKAMFNSPNERARALAVFGPTGVGKMETRMTLETIMDGARKAMGNSTTARQLIEAGLAGGALGGYEGYEHFGVLGGIVGTITGVGAGRAAAKKVGSEMAAGAQKLIGKVNSKTAALVAELLTSNDPRKLQQGLAMAQKNQKIADGLRSIADRIALAGQTKAIPHITIHPQGPVPGYADTEQQEAPRPIH